MIRSSMLNGAVPQWPQIQREVEYKVGGRAASPREAPRSQMRPKETFGRSDLHEAKRDTAEIPNSA